MELRMLVDWLDQGAEANETKLQWLGLGMPISDLPPPSFSFCIFSSLLLSFIHASMVVLPGALIPQSFFIFITRWCRGSMRWLECARPT